MCTPSRLLITARDYLAYYFKCRDDIDLLRALEQDPERVDAVIDYNWWVRLDKSDVCPVDVYMQDEYWNLHHAPAAETMAYQKHGCGVTVARHYARKAQPLEHPALPPIVFRAICQVEARGVPTSNIHVLETSPLSAPGEALPPPAPRWAHLRGSRRFSGHAK